MMGQIIFFCLFVLAVVIFARNARRIYKNIKLGKAVDRNDKPAERLKLMLLVAFGQKKKFKQPLPALLHLRVYEGICIINMDILASVIDGLRGTHRIIASIGSIYNGLIYAFEWLAFAVLFSCIIFLIRRNALHIYRFSGRELKNWPKTDANLILIAEILLMTAFLFMNAADFKLQQLHHPAYHHAGAFPVSQFLLPLLPESVSTLVGIERFSWWFHIIGVLVFLNYLPISKHLHIIL